MPKRKKRSSGEIIWRDLTVADADALQRFYTEMVGWRAQPFEGDFNMVIPGTDAPIAGICHAKGVNSKLPAQWLMYVTVDDLTKSIRAARKWGGKVIDGPRDIGKARFCVVQDPAGAVIALYQTSPVAR